MQSPGSLHCHEQLQQAVEHCHPCSIRVQNEGAQTRHVQECPGHQSSVKDVEGPFDGEAP